MERTTRRDAWRWLAASPLALLIAAGCAMQPRTVVVQAVEVPLDGRPVPGAPAPPPAPAPVPPPAVDAAPVESWHVVAPGETAWRIARAHGVTVEALARANGLDDPSRLAAGARLRIPRAPGALVAPRPSPTGMLGWPVQGGRVLSAFGVPRGRRSHRGVDISGGLGEPVLAAASGRVAYAGSGMRGYGRTVILEHDGGLSTLYAHNSKLLVREGQRVGGGQPIAHVGRTGNATGEHCHFEVRRDGRALDPLGFLEPATAAARGGTAAAAR